MMTLQNLHPSFTFHCPVKTSWCVLWAFWSASGGWMGVRKIALTMNLSASPSPSPAVKKRGWFPSLSPPSPTVKTRGWFFNGRIQTDPRAKTPRCYVVKSRLLLASFCPKSRTLLSDFFGFSLGKERVRVTHMVKSSSRTPLIKTAKKAIVIDIKRMRQV